MFERILRISIHQRGFVLLAVMGMAMLRNLQLPAPLHRCRAGYYQCPGPDKYPGARIFAPRSGAAVTYPIETVMAGLPRLEYTRSIRATGYRRSR